MMAMTHAPALRRLVRRALPLVGGAALAAGGIGGGIVLLMGAVATGRTGYLLLALPLIGWGVLVGWHLLLPCVPSASGRWYDDRSARKIFLASAGNAPFTLHYRDATQAFPLWSIRPELQPPCAVTELFEALGACLARVPNFVEPPSPVALAGTGWGVDMSSRFLTERVESNVVGLEYRRSGMFAVHLRWHTRRFRIRSGARDRFERDALAVIARNVVALVAEHGEVVAKPGHPRG